MAQRYLGRVVGVGLTTDEHLFSFYLVTGRSSGSQARRAKIYPAEQRVAIEPLESAEKIRQMGQDPDLLLYNAM